MPSIELLPEEELVNVANRLYGLRCKVLRIKDFDIVLRSVEVLMALKTETKPQDGIDLSKIIHLRAKNETTDLIITQGLLALRIKVDNVQDFVLIDLETNKRLELSPLEDLGTINLNMLFFETLHKKEIESIKNTYFKKQ